MRLSTSIAVRLSVSLFVIGAGLSAGCGGDTTTGSDGSTSIAGDGDGDTGGDGDGDSDDVTPGDECPLMGQTGTSDCNTCTCDGGTWSCTERACPEPECTEGDSKKLDCNTCECTGGGWLCTEIGCGSGDEVCQDGEYHTEGTQLCICQDNAWQCDEVGNTDCKPEDFPDDGCNACSCVDGQIVCTDLYCPPTTCVEGASKEAEDGCNTCSCAEGQWACTKKACIGPVACGARAGDTCSETEYCAYEEGDLCGAADAEASCKPRPEVCDLSYEPVCGCDGITYGNACAAASAGTGVIKSEPCETAD